MIGLSFGNLFGCFLKHLINALLNNAFLHSVSGLNFLGDSMSSIFTMEFLSVEWGISMKYFWGIRRILGAAWRMFILTA